jgi:hypothetical protein
MDDNTYGEPERAIILCGLWSVWRSRNDRLHGKAPIEMRASIDWALDVCFHLITVKETSSRMAGPVLNQQWRRPPVGVLKINVDGAYSVEAETGVVGAVSITDTSDFMMEMTTAGFRL